MIPSQITEFIRLIRNGSKVNTYKLVWAKSIVECCRENPEATDISLEDIAEKVFKYYWNQTIYFDLAQGNNPNKRPTILKYIREEIQTYLKKSGSNKPVHFEKVEDETNINLKHLVSILKLDVSHRFLNLNGEVSTLYSYKKGDDLLTIDCAQEISEYSDILHECINFKWTQVLENFNHAPRIAKKVRIMDFPEVKRKSLSPFKPYLDIVNPEHICFMCDKTTIKKELSIDHVIPWSFIYCDDLWNLVYCCASCNSSKSDLIVKQKHITKLEARNSKLLALATANDAISKKKPMLELKLAIEKDYVKKFWINCSN